MVWDGCFVASTCGVVVDDIDVDVFVVSTSGISVWCPFVNLPGCNIVLCKTNGKYCKRVMAKENRPLQLETEANHQFVTINYIIVHA